MTRLLDADTLLPTDNAHSSRTGACRKRQLNDGSISLHFEAGRDCTTQLRSTHHTPLAPPPLSSLSHSARLQRPTKQERWRAFEQTARYCTDRCPLSTTDRAGEELGTKRGLPCTASDRAEK